MEESGKKLDRLENRVAAIKAFEKYKTEAMTLDAGFAKTDMADGGNLSRHNAKLRQAGQKALASFSGYDDIRADFEKEIEETEAAYQRVALKNHRDANM